MQVEVAPSFDQLDDLAYRPLPVTAFLARRLATLRDAVVNALFFAPQQPVPDEDDRRFDDLNGDEGSG